MTDRYGALPVPEQLKSALSRAKKRARAVPRSRLSEHIKQMNTEYRPGSLEYRLHPSLIGDRSVEYGGHPSLKKGGFA